MLSRKYRLRGTAEVAKVYRRGRGARSGAFTMKEIPNGLPLNRLSVVVSKKVAKSAPLRNRIRRRVYGHFGQIWALLAPGHDMVISVFSADVAKLPPPQLAQQLNDLAKQAGLAQSL